MGEHIRYIQSALISCYIKSDSYWDWKFQQLVLTIIEYALIDNRNYNGQNQCTEPNKLCAGSSKSE